MNGLMDVIDGGMDEWIPGRDGASEGEAGSG